MAKRVPAGWKLVLVVHYASAGRAGSDQTRIGLTLAAAQHVRREVATRALTVADLVIPPHAAAHRVAQEERLDQELLLLAMLPHMHLRGKSFRYEASYPDGTREVLLDVPRYDFHWQHRYELAAPKRLPAGTVLRCVAEYDNSSANPSNPDPSATVRSGPRSTDEMFNGYYDVALANKSPSVLERVLGRALVLRWHALSKGVVAMLPLTLVACAMLMLARAALPRERTPAALHAADGRIG
jgi:hypothetical protein